jgi:hypothetical protein
MRESMREKPKYAPKYAQTKISTRASQRAYLSTLRSQSVLSTFQRRSAHCQVGLCGGETLCGGDCTADESA